MTLPGLLDDIAAALAPIADEIPDLTVYAYWSDVPTPPALDVYPATPFQTGGGFGPAANQVNLTVRARVTMADIQAGQQTLLRMLDPTDPASVEQALAVADLAVAPDGITGFRQYADDAPVNERMLGCEWRVITFLE